MTPASKLVLQRASIENTKRLFALPQRRRAQRAYELSRDEFAWHQRSLLDEVLSDALAHVPFYRESGDYQFVETKREISAQDVLADFPVLRKATVKADPRRFWRDPLPLGSRIHTTGGTTGTPMQVAAGIKDRGLTEAILEARYRRDAGVRAPRILRLTGLLTAESGDFVTVPLARTAYQSIYTLSPARRSQIEQSIVDFQPHVIHGYASALAQLGHVFAGGDELAKLVPRLRGAFSTSETLDESTRHFIEAGLGVPVFNEYGSQEGQHLVLECRERGMHIHPDRGIVEVLDLDSDTPVAPGSLGRVVVTGLMARAMPLIRYELGDTAMAVEADRQCTCGLAWPLIGEVYGRQEDLVRTPDGRRIGLLAHSTLKDVPGIRQAQVQQLSHHRFRYLVVPEAGALPAEAQDGIRQSLMDRLGYVAEVDFEYVDHIELTSSGKLRAVVVKF